MATLLSWSAVWCRDWVYNDRRVGAWGPTWIFALFPLSLLGLVVRFRRGGDRAFTVVLAVLYFYFLFKSEGSWWSRFSLSHFGIALALTAAALADIGKPAARGLLAAAIVVLSFVTAAEAVVAIRQHNDRRPYFPPEGQYLHSLQVYRPFTYGESKHDRELYEWVGTTMEPGETFVYYHPAWSGLYHYWFYRRDFRNRVYGYDSSKDLVSMARLLHRRDTTYFMVQDLPDNRVFDWAPLIGDLVFKTGRFHVYRFDPERARPIHGEEDD
jgi:hypothetical protein